MKILKIGSRKSDLARWQAFEVAAHLKRANPGLKIEFLFKTSLGDQRTDLPLWKLPEKGVFTEDFVSDLKDSTVDLVVHSWKDLPTEPRPFTQIIATLPRADVRDVFLLKRSALRDLKHFQLNRPLRVFTSSPRRAYNLKRFFNWALPFHFEGLEFVDIRGNIPTRITKLLSNEGDGLILAKAALDRLLQGAPIDPDTGLPFEDFNETQKHMRSILDQCYWMVLPLTENPAAAAQGALAVEIQKDRDDLKTLFLKINHEKTFREVTLERQTLKSYGGGCHQKIGVSRFEKPYGEVTFLKGLTDQGEVLNQFTLTPTKPWPKPKSWESCWPNVNAVDLFERLPFQNAEILNSLKALQLDGPLACWVSKLEALPKDLFFQKDKLDLFIGDSRLEVVWAGGLKTWKKLASQNVWVNGSNESLGEELPPLQYFVSDKLSWFKVSHDEAPRNESFPLLATYTLKPKPGASLEVTGKTHFFWPSGSAFTEVIKRYPEVLNAYHFCGPGNTWHILKKHIPHERLFVALDWSQWAEEMKGRVI